MISFSAFADEFVKIKLAAMPSPAAMQKILHGIGRSSGKLGKAAVPRSTPMTMKIVGGKMVKTPIRPRAVPPPIPMH